MTDTAEHPTTTLSADPPTPPPVTRDASDRARPNRLYQALAWVGIVAGVVFIVAVVFFSGFILGKHSDGSHGMWGNHGKGVHVFHRGPPPPMVPMGPWGPGAPPSPTTVPTPRP
jgi:hypothetical protein